MWFQTEFSLRSRSRGFHLITEDILSAMTSHHLPKIGLCHIYIQHSSASLTINENADPTVRQDFESFFNRCVPENQNYFKHNDEGSDDMPAHLKSSILGSSVTVPITNYRLNLGIWQGVYLCEHRNWGGDRKLVVTIHGEG